VPAAAAAGRASDDALGPPGHLGGSPARKRHQQNPARIGAVDDQVGDAVRQSTRLAAAGAGNDEKRPRREAIRLAVPVLDSLSLFRVQLIEIGEGQG